MDKWRWDSRRSVQFENKLLDEFQSIYLTFIFTKFNPLTIARKRIFYS